LVYIISNCEIKIQNEYSNNIIIVIVSMDKSNVK
jgi:hypothetical protein